MRAGFADPVADAAAAFRSAMEATARPGRVAMLRALPDAPPGLAPATAALALVLLDSGTPVWTDAGDEARAWLLFHCGAPPVAPERAAFLLCAGAPPALRGLGLGSDEAPQDGATLVLEARSLREGAGWRLAGPGIEHEHRLAAPGLPAGFARERAALAPLFPRGLDVFLCAGACLAALPRTTRIEEEAACTSR